MDLTTKNHLEPSTLFVSQMGATLDETSKKNTFLGTFSDHHCKMNIQETSEFVKSFPVAKNGTESRGFLEGSTNGSRDNGVKKGNLEAPSTPGRPIFSFSNGGFSRKSYPSKWDDAEKWVVSPRNNHGLLKPFESSKMFSKQSSRYKLPQQLGEVFSEVKVSKIFSTFERPLGLDHHKSSRAINGSLSASADLLLKDKFTSDVKPTCPKFGSLEPMKEGFLFGNAADKSMDEEIKKLKHREIGTEMTRLSSSSTSRCHTPSQGPLPVRQNTPANITHLPESPLKKLNLGTEFDSVRSNWSSREEEDEDLSKSLRHSEISTECWRSVSDLEEEETTKSCLRYQREAAKIQAWVNLQSAKAEAESRKLEVKIETMRSKLEEKLMKKMAEVHQKAEEWRTVAQFQHLERIRKGGQQSDKVLNRKNSGFSGHKSCGCFPAL